MDCSGQLRYGRASGHQIDVRQNPAVFVGQPFCVRHWVNGIHAKELEDSYVQGELDTRPQVFPEDLAPDVGEGSPLSVVEVLRPNDLEPLLPRDVLYQALRLRPPEGQLGLPARRDDDQALVLLPKSLEVLARVGKVHLVRYDQGGFRDFSEHPAEVLYLLLAPVIDVFPLEEGLSQRVLNMLLPHPHALQDLGDGVREARTRHPCQLRDLAYVAGEELDIPQDEFELDVRQVGYWFSRPRVRDFPVLINAPGRIHHVEQCAGLGRHGEELVAQPLPHPGPLYQPRQVGDLDWHEPPAVLAARICWIVFHVELLVDTDCYNTRDSRLGGLGGEGVVGDLTREKRHRVVEGRLPRVCLPNNSYSYNHLDATGAVAYRDKKIPDGLRGGSRPPSSLRLIPEDYGGQS